MLRASQSIVALPGRMGAVVGIGKGVFVAGVRRPVDTRSATGLAALNGHGLLVPGPGSWPLVVLGGSSHDQRVVNVIVEFGKEVSPAVVEGPAALARIRWAEAMISVSDYGMGDGGSVLKSDLV
jgi:hypothetical protein